MIAASDMGNKGTSGVYESAIERGIYEGSGDECR
jgi:hypothetical protein